MLTLPSVLQDFVRNNKIISPFIQYLQQFTIPPPAFLEIDPDSSPFSYTSVEPGVVYVAGGTVSQITLTRGSDTILVALDTSTPRFVPVAIADTVTITYTVLPTVKFIFSYGVDTHNF